MATNFKATLEVQCWKQHTCSHCGTVYRYLFKRKKTGQAGTEDAAREAANNAVVKALEKEVDMRPCPECGRYQVDMIAARRFRWHLWLLVTALSLYLLGIFLGGIYAFSTATSLYLLAMLSLPLVLINLFIAIGNPNSNLRANRKVAERLLASGMMQRGAEADPAEEPAPVEDRVGVGPWLASGSLLAALLFLPTAAWIEAANGWPSNPEWHPVVFGPGDTSWVWLKHQVRSVKGYWRGRAFSTVLNDQELGLADNQIPTTTRDNDWGNTISVKSSERDNSATIWVRLHLPDRPELAGKKVKVHIKLVGEYPQMDPADHNKFLVHPLDANEVVEFHLAAPRAGFLLSAFWWLSTLGTGLAFTLAGSYFLLRARALAACALPTQVIPLDEAEDEDDREPIPKSRKRERDEDDEPVPKKRKRPARDDD